jgi:hypothetical protein
LHNRLCIGIITGVKRKINKVVTGSPRKIGWLTRGERRKRRSQRSFRVAHLATFNGGVFERLIHFQRLGSLTVFASGINSSASVTTI